MILEFTVELMPISKQTQRLDTNAWHILCQQKFLNVLRREHQIKIFFPEILEVIFYFHNDDPSQNEQPHFGHIDTDNCLKQLQDCLFSRKKKLKYLPAGDQTIYKIIATKLWTDTDSRIEVKLTGKVIE